MQDAILLDLPFEAPPNDENRTAWLAERKRGIGGSDAAAILGLSRWRSSWQVWAEKTGQIPDAETNEAMHWGTVAEDIIAREWSRRTGKAIRRRSQIIRHKEHDIIAASIDRDVLNECAGLEIKKVTAYMAEEWERNGPPPDVMFQVHHYLLATGWDRWYIAAWFGHKMVCWCVERDQETLDALLAAELAWWQAHIVEGKEPDPDGSPAYTEAIKKRHARSDDSMPPVEIPHALAQRYLEAQANRKLWEQAEEQAKQALMLTLGESTAGACAFGRVTWKEQKGRASTDFKRLEQDHPGLLDNYRTQGEPTRVLRISLKGE